MQGYNAIGAMRSRFEDNLPSHLEEMVKLCCFHGSSTNSVELFHKARNAAGRVLLRSTTASTPVLNIQVVLLASELSLVPGPGLYVACRK